MGEALAIVVRYISDDWVIWQKLVCLQILAKSFEWRKSCKGTNQCAFRKFLGLPNQLLAVMQDRASVNEVALKTVKIVYPYNLSVGCFSCTIDHVREHFNTPILAEFITT